MKTSAVIGLLVVLTVLRCIWVASNDVAPGEAYYWACSNRMAPAFFDGPPGTAAVVAACGHLGGTPLSAVRLLWPVLAMVASVLGWRLAGQFFDGVAAVWAVVFLNMLPGFNVASVTLGPAMPALVLVLGGLLFAKLAWAGRPNAWAFAGMFLGGAVFFRYEAVLVAAGVAGATLLVKRHRSRGDVWGAVWVLLAVVLALWWPMVWNAGLEWIPVAGGTLQTAWEIRWAEFPFALAADGVSVPGALVLIGGAAWLFLDAREHELSRFLASACVLPLAWWFYMALRGQPAGTVALLGAVPVMVFFASRVAKRAVPPGVALAVCMILGGFSMLAIVASAGERALAAQIADQLRAAVRDLPAGEGDGFLIAEDPDMAALLGLKLKPLEKSGYPPVFVPESPDLPNQFGLWPSYADFLESPVTADEYFTEQRGVNPFIGRHAIYFGSDLPQTISGAFELVTPLRRIRTPDGRMQTIYLCQNYQTLPL